MCKWTLITLKRRERLIERQQRHSGRGEGEGEEKRRKRSRCIWRKVGRGGTGPALNGLSEKCREIPVNSREFSCHFHDLKPGRGPVHVSRYVSKQKPSHVVTT